MLISKVFQVRNIFMSIKNAKMPIKTSYQIARFLQATETSNTFYQEKFQEIVDNYAEHNEDGTYVLAADGQSIKIQPEHSDACVLAVKELEEMDVEIPNIKINPNDLENTELTVDQMYILMPLLSE